MSFPSPSLNIFLFVAAAAAAGEAAAIQEPPFARPAHDDVVPVARQAVPGGPVELLPHDDGPLVRIGMSAPTVQLNAPLGIDARIALPEDAPLTALNEVVLRLTVTKPAGCYRTDADVKTVDGLRHLVTVALFGAADEPCVASKSVESVDVAMGRLAPGEHTIVVGDGVKTFVTLTLNVHRPVVGLAE